MRVCRFQRKVIQNTCHISCAQILKKSRSLPNARTKGVKRLAHTPAHLLVANDCAAVTARAAWKPTIAGDRTREVLAEELHEMKIDFENVIPVSESGKNWGGPNLWLFDGREALPDDTWHNAFMFNLEWLSQLEQLGRSFDRAWLTGQAWTMSLAEMALIGLELSAFQIWHPPKGITTKEEQDEAGWQGVLPFSISIPKINEQFMDLAILLMKPSGEWQEISVYRADRTSHASILSMPDLDPRLSRKDRGLLAEAISQWLEFGAKKGLPITDPAIVKKAIELQVSSIEPVFAAIGWETGFGPVPPNLFIYGTKQIELQNKPWHMINTLWKARRKTLPQDIVAKIVWGDEDVRPDQRKGVIKKANHAFMNAGFPFSVCEKNGFIVLESFEKRLGRKRAS